MTRLVLTFVVAMLLSFAGALNEAPTQPASPKSPLSAAEAMKHFRLPPGLRIELVAQEPMVQSPVAMAFGEDGRLWVVEMRDYPNGPPPGKPPQGRVRVLEDRDGDGYYEFSRLFADELLFANGILPWRDGALITAAPHIALLRDTDGDKEADKTEVLYQGFATLNPQLRVSHPVLGIDNWIYVANGLRGGAAKRSGKADAPVINLSGMDFRFDLVHDRAEAITGMGQFGNTMDDWGRRFVCDNRHHLRHVVLENRYVMRNPYLAAPSLVQDISVLEDGPLSSGGKIYPLSKNWTTSSLHEGRFTAACGVFIYRGDLLPKEYQGCAFTCDPTGNLVHQEILTQKGATFEGRPAQKGVEFFASPDDWFRPVFLADGPDGALYVVDMYRAVIEHPEFMPPELKNRPDLVLGRNMGRIWRIVPEKHVTKGFRPGLGTATTDDLVSLLEHPNAWWRTTAQRLLLERRDETALGRLERMVRYTPNAPTRVHAAYLLDNFNRLSHDLTAVLLSAGDARVREHGVKLAERALKDSSLFQSKIIKLAADPDPQVRFQVALTLGEWDDAKIVDPLVEVALAGVEDRWTRLAVSSSLGKRAPLALKQLLASDSFLSEITPGRLAMVQEWAGLIRTPEGVRDFLDGLKSVQRHRYIMAGLKGLNAQVVDSSSTLFSDSSWIPKFILNMPAVAGDSKRSLAERLDAIHLLAFDGELALKTLVPMLTEHPDQEVRLAAVQTLDRVKSPQVSSLLMKSWRLYTPAVRRAVTEAMFRQPARIQFLLSELEASRVKSGDFDALRTRQLVNHTRPEIRDRARKLLQDNLPADRKEVLARYQESLKHKGDEKRGMEVFKKNCVTCHRVAGIGTDVGPDIADTRTKTLEALLLDIISPNQAIDNNYINYLVTTKSGKSVTGVIASETASSLTLKRAEGQSDVILRQDVDEIQSTGISLMPEGLEKTITIPEMADLLAFLKNWRYMDGAVPTGK